jgi:periplasmic divalent cation tolerance protein
VDEIVDVTVTGENVDQLADLTRRLVEDGLVACGNIVPGVRSIYAWQGRVEDDSESLVLLHTRKALVSKVIERIIQEHPYDTPQVLAIPVSDANPAYREWLVAETSRGRS